MDIILGILVGISLSAACGFRVFVPLFVMSIASLSGHLDLAPGFEWIGSYPALVCFAVATGIEITAYFVPLLDNILDTIATPAAVVAGIVVTASCVSGISPFLRWSLAVIAGGGAAWLVQGFTVLVRAGSTAATGGAGNPAVSSAEAGGSVALASLAIAFPLVVGIAVLALLILAARKVFAKLSV